MNSSRVAIVILNWNGRKLLEQYLPSVIQHSQGDDVEVIVADNQSTDESVSFLRENFPQVKILQLDQNYGFAKGYNVALQQIQAKYYILLNSDVEVTSNWIAPLIDLMERDETVAAVQPKVLSWQRKDEFEYAGAAGGFIDKLGYPFCRGRIFNVLEKDEGQFDQVTDIFWATGACMAVRADCFHQAGGFDADFWAHMEEIDLCWRLKNRGYKIQFTPFSKVYHLGGGSLSYDNPKKLFLNFRNSLWLLYKNLPRHKFYKVIVLRMLLDGVAAFKLLSEGNTDGFTSVIRAHWAFYRLHRQIRHKREELKKMATPIWPDEVLCKSIIWKFYIEGKKTFREVEQ
ncbi:glycosyltransferase family 2 protein [Sunxiuqinia dokdonensis]|uniref:Glycosyl transferase family 2 n=1 Tax=Sunxiuqinia dokdonensis TaxID=1409788 RepID=A0A0L8V3K8_9BACT|nr:glycosyltransferase family 2 protein [Sunxiuqinia dokdonensis]KOH42958.1 glycosyl transferase family 2 [Sunxiuqinia dokdonensis]